jgi:hypothetical protein
MDPLAEYEKNRYKGHSNEGYISVNALALVKLKKAFDNEINQKVKNGKMSRLQIYRLKDDKDSTFRAIQEGYINFLKEDISNVYQPHEKMSLENFKRPLVGEMEGDIKAAYEYYENVLESIKTSLNYNHNRREEERAKHNKRQSNNAKFFDYLRWRRELSEIKGRLAPLLDYRTSHADMELAQPLIDNARSLLSSEPNTPDKKQTREAEEEKEEVRRLLERIEGSKRARQRRHNNQRAAANASRRNWGKYYNDSLSQPSFFPNRARELSRLPASERSPGYAHSRSRSPGYAGVHKDAESLTRARARSRSRSRERYSGGNRTRKNRNKK